MAIRILGDPPSGDHHIAASPGRREGNHDSVVKQRVRRMGRAKRNPSASERAARLMGFAPPYPSYDCRPCESRDHSHKEGRRSRASETKAEAIDGDAVIHAGAPG